MNADSAHALALRLATNHGIPVTFSVSAPSTEDANGQTTPGGVTSVSGFLIQDDNSQPSESFEKLKLVTASAERYQFVPQTLNALPPIGSKHTTANVPQSLNSIDPYRMGANAEAPYAWVVLV